MTEIVPIDTGYLLRGQEGAVLVDASKKTTPERVRELLGELPLKLIALTHAHADHTAGAGLIARTFKVPIALHPADEELLLDGNARPMLSRGLVGGVIRLLSGWMARSATSADFRPDLPLEEGMELAPYGVDAVAIALPGHTQGSVALLVDGRELICGDAMMNMVGITPARIFEDERKMLWSVERIRSCGARRVYPGHGKPFDIRKFK